MLSWEADLQARASRQLDWSISAIARYLQADRKTVRAYLPGEREPGKRSRSPPTLIEPFLECCRRRPALVGLDPVRRAGRDGTFMVRVSRWGFVEGAAGDRANMATRSGECRVVCPSGSWEHHELMSRPSRPVTVVVADAMILLRMSCRLALDSGPTALAIDATRTGHARIYITAEVEHEVIQRMERVAKHVTAEAALAAWRTLLAPSITVVDLPFGDVLHPAVRGIVELDPDDVLTGALALLVGPALVWSEDHSLTDTGFASALSWRETGEVLVEVATTEAAWAGGLGLTALTATTSSSSRRPVWGLPAKVRSRRSAWVLASAPRSSRWSVRAVLGGRGRVPR